MNMSSFSLGGEEVEGVGLDELALEDEELEELATLLLLFPPTFMLLLLLLLTLGLSMLTSRSGILTGPLGPGPTLLIVALLILNTLLRLLLLRSILLLLLFVLRSLMLGELRLAHGPRAGFPSLAVDNIST